MKKILKSKFFISSLRFVVAFMLLSSSVLLLGCKSKEEQISDFSGTWNLESVKNTAQDTPEDIMDQLKQSGLSYQLILQNNGTGTLDLAGTKSNLTWDTNSDNEATIISEDKEIKINLKEEKITLIEDDMQMVFSK